MNSRKFPRKKNPTSMRMLGAQLQAARKAAGYTQRSLTEAVLVDEETIASIEQGRRSLLIDLARSIDEVLDTKDMLATGVENLPEIDQFPPNMSATSVRSSPTASAPRSPPGSMPSMPANSPASTTSHSTCSATSTP